MKRSLLRRLSVAFVALFTLGSTLLAPSEADAATRPTVSAISVHSGSTSGGNRITIKGSHFRKVKKVLFGNRVGTGLKVLSSKRLTVVAPPGKAGWVSIKVVAKAGTSKATTKARYHYLAPAPAPSPTPGPSPTPTPSPTPGPTPSPGLPSVVLTASTPTISGAAFVGTILAVNAGAWTPAPVSLGYQWFRSETPIGGAIGSSYAVSNDDMGKHLSVAVTGSKPGFASVTRTSPQTDVIKSSGSGKVMARTQRMSAATLNSTQNGWYESGSVLTLSCYVHGQAVKGYFSGSYPNGWDDLWYLVSDGSYVADVDVETGTTSTVGNACSAPAPTGDLAAIALANVGKGPCSTNSAGGTGYFGSCGEPWCADFVKWVWQQAGYSVDGITAAAGSFVTGRSGSKLHRDSGYAPQVGDAVVFNYKGGGAADHVGMIVAVHSNGSVDVVHGNINSRVTLVRNVPANQARVGAAMTTDQLTVGNGATPVVSAFATP